MLNYIQLLAENPNSTIRELERAIAAGGGLVSRPTLIAALENLRSMRPPLAERPRLTDRWRLTADGRRIAEASAEPDDSDPEADPEPEPAPKPLVVPRSMRIAASFQALGRATIYQAADHAGLPPATPAARYQVSRRLRNQGLIRKLRRDGRSGPMIFEWIGGES